MSDDARERINEMKVSDAIGRKIKYRSTETGRLRSGVIIRIGFADVVVRTAEKFANTVRYGDIVDVGE